MKKRLTRRFVLVTLICTFAAVLMCGCGRRDSALDTYKANMEAYFSSVAAINNNMNSIIITDEMTKEEHDAAYSKLLTCLDQLSTITFQMSELEVPKDFSLTEGLADEAAENMASAVELYHQLYESEVYDEGIADAAYEYYERANMRIQYIRSILQGEIPDGLEIEYTEE